MFTILLFFAFFTVLSHIIVIFEHSFLTLVYLTIIPVTLTLYLKNKSLKYISLTTNSNPIQTQNHLTSIALIVCIIITIFSGKYDTDEGFYSSIAIHTLENPHQALLKYDGMYGEDDIPVLHPSYKVQAYQTLEAVISYLTNIDPPLVRHIFFPVIGTILFFLTWKNLFKLFLANEWGKALIIFLGLVFLLGGHRNITNYSITRFYDGKCLLMNMIIPLFLYHSILFFREQNNKRIIYLTIIQICAVGLSSSGLYLLPLATIILGIINWRPNYSQTRKCFIYGTSSLYVVMAGALLKYNILTGNFGDPEGMFTKVTPIYYMNQILPPILEVFGGSSIARIISIISIFSAYKFYPKDSDLRKTLFFLPLIVIFIVMNPLLVNIMSSLSTIFNYWRFLYLAPIALFITICILGISNKINIKYDNKKIFIPIIAFLILLVPYINRPHDYTLNPYNWETDNIFAPNFDPKAYEICKIIKNNTPHNSLALAPIEISSFLPGIDDAPKVVAVKNYIIRLTHAFGEKNTQQRIRIHNIISGSIANFSDEEFIRSLQDLNIGSVTLHKELPNKDRITNILINQGYIKNSEEKYGYTIWTKTPTH